MPTVIIDGQPLYYAHRRGPAGAPTLVLIHGAGGTHLDWPRELRRLPQAGVIALDLPGHGRSALPGREEIGGYAAAVQALLGGLPPGDYVLAGHSMGGAIAQEIALQRPAWLRGLVLIGTGARLPVNPLLIEQTTTEFQRAVDFIVRYYWSPQASPEQLALSRTQLAKTSPDVLRGDFLACDRFDRREAVARIEAPALVISSHADKLVPHKFGAYLAATIPRAELLSLEDAAHMMVLEQPERIAAAIASFLARLAAGEMA
jgi:pimeloyl-ACP methyl ester carboxylesterase